MPSKPAWPGRPSCKDVEHALTRAKSWFDCRLKNGIAALASVADAYPIAPGEPVSISDMKKAKNHLHLQPSPNFFEASAHPRAATTERLRRHVEHRCGVDTCVGWRASLRNLLVDTGPVGPLAG